MRCFHVAIVCLISLAIPAFLHAEDAAGCVARANAHLEKREFDKAIADCEKALDLDSRTAEAYSTRARAWIGKAGRDDADNALEAWDADCRHARDDCDKALVLDHKLADVYVCRARVWVGKKEFKKAVADCDNAIALEPKFAQAYATRAYARSSLGDVDKAISDCDKALALDPKLADAYVRRAAHGSKNASTKRRSRTPARPSRSILGSGKFTLIAAIPGASWAILRKLSPNTS